MKSCQKGATPVFLPKNYGFQNSPKGHSIFNLILYENCCKKTFKIAQSSHSSLSHCDQIRNKSRLNLTEMLLNNVDTAVFP